MGVFLDRMVTKKRYLKEQDLVELMALCSILPGPTSTQTIVSIGYRMGGRKLAFFTMIVWALPVLFVMGFLSFGYQVLSSMNVSHSILRFIGPMAVGFIIVAALRIGRKVVTDLLSLGLLLSSAVLTFFFRSPWVFPLVLAAGGLISILIKREKGMWNPVQIRPPWGYLVLFAALAVGGLAAASLTDFRLLENFERFYRYGYLVFGGGQVVVPVMYGELVDIR